MTEMGHPGWHDWVGELFEPAFGATIDDLVAHEKDADNKPKIKHVSVHDPDAVRKVYERVHMMTVLDEEMRVQKARQAKTQQRADTLGQQQQLSGHPESVTNGEKESAMVDLLHTDESCIWNNAEISVLRKAYRQLKEQSIESMVHVRETLKRNEDLETLTKKQQQVIAQQKVKLSNANMANKRLHINVTALNDEVKYLTAKVGAMEDVIRELKQEHSDMVQELHDNRVTMDKERMERGRIQIKLDSLQKEALAEKQAAEDEIRTQCKKAIHDLKETVKSLEKQLKVEKDKRKVTDKGLKHLRNHFSSLAVADILPQNAVHTDQLHKVQY